MNNYDKRSIRKLARTARRSLSTQEQDMASHQLARIAKRQKTLINAKRIACYLPDDGEPSLLIAMHELHALGKEIYLPVIYPGRRQYCRFALWTPTMPMVIGKFGIEMPSKGFAAGIAANALDVILMPLVAFDDEGNRLGRGGGFYDRSLEFLRYRKYWKRPKLIGIAHRCQRVERIPMDDWDIPTDSIIAV